MALASEVIDRAASLIVVRAAEQPLTADEVNTFIELLNDMLTEWEAAGIALGFTKVHDRGDEMTVADSTLRAIKYNLAICAAPEFDKQVPPALSGIADASYRNLLMQFITPPSTSFPNTLPIGTGNECNGSIRYFPGPEENVLLDEIDGSLLVEENTGD